MLALDARFNPTRFMTVHEYNQLPGTSRRQENGKCYTLHDGKWCKVGFRKPAVAKPAKVEVREAA